MRNLRTKTWAKAAACVVCVVSLTASIFSLSPAEALAGNGAYQEDGYTVLMENREHALVTGLTYQVLDIYESQKTSDNYLLDIDNCISDPNFFYTIKDKNGKTLSASEELGDYREKYPENFELYYPGEEVTIHETYDSLQARYDAKRAIEAEHSDAIIELSSTGMRYGLTATYTEGDYTESVTVTGFLRADLEPQGEVYRTLHQAQQMYSIRHLYLGLLVGGAILGLLSLIFLTWSAGRHEDTHEIVLHWVDTHVPLELPLILAFFCGVFGLTLTWQDDMANLSMITVYMILGILLCVTLFLAMYLSLVRRIKAKALWDNMLLRKLSRPGRWVVDRCRRAGRAIHRGGSQLMAKLPLFWMAGVGFLAVFFLEALCMYGYSRTLDGGWLFLWLMVKLAEGGILVYAVLSMRELQSGGYQLAQGNLDYKVPLEKLRWDFKTHGEHLNSMRTAIQAAVEDQMKSERMKTELITNVSHDIKTPLTSIVNYVDLLKKQEMPTDEAKEYLEVLDRQSAKLKKLTEDLVEAAKATTGNITVNFQRTDVNVLLTQSAGEYQEKLQSKDLQLLLTPAKDAPAISADGRLLWRVFENLLSNIYKYALPGTRVYLTCAATETQVTVTFRNISASPLNISADELMERFVRGDDARHTEGSGLGLSIARSLTQLQHGDFQLAIDGDLFKAILTFPRIS